jgi:endonuclease YncB( thermonuclease family)
MNTDEPTWANMPAVPLRHTLKDAPPKQQVYRALIEAAYDGDTVTVLVELGLGHWFRSQCRLSGINAPEMRGHNPTAGALARDYLRKLVSGKWVYLRTDKDKLDKYGRVLGRIFLPSPVTGPAATAGLLDVNAHMIEAGHAVAYLEDRDATREALTPGLESF